MNRKQILVFSSFIFLFVSFAFGQTQKSPKTITINSVRKMEVFKKDGKPKQKTDTATLPQETGMQQTAAENPAEKEQLPESKAADQKTPEQTPVSDVPTAAGQPAAPPDEAVRKTENTPQSNPDTEAAKEYKLPADSTKDDIILLEGNVSLSVKDNQTTSTITADKVIYNRAEQTLEASGNVKYARKTGSAPAEEFTGEMLLFDIEKMEGAFIEGAIKQPPRNKNVPPFTIRSPLVGRDASGTTGFTKAILSTNTDLEDDPLWSIRASRIWLLPGNELAFANGYFSIGIVPLFYIPFFYHPSDEMIFHPVFGFRNREGSFVQTTTYLIGRPPLETGEKAGSFSSFLNSDTLKKQERHGLFYKNLDENETNPSPNYLKLIADAYSSLGGTVGIEGKFVPADTPVKQVDFSLYFGMSRTLFPPPNTGSLSHTAYDRQGNRYYNKSYLYGIQVPFRYRAHINLTISKNPVSFTLNLPFPSDPFFKKDFFDRSENMNWFAYALNQDTLAKGKDMGSETSHTWKLDFSLRPSIKYIQPWITSLNIDTASFIVDFASKDNRGILPVERATGPHRSFFYPRMLKPSLKVSISGTLLSNSMFEAKKPKGTGAVDLAGIPSPFSTASTAGAAADPAQSERQAIESQTESTPEISTKPAVAEKKDTPPEFVDLLFPRFTPVYEGGGNPRLTYSLTYQGDFSVLQETAFAASLWNKPEDIRWSSYDSRYYRLNGSASLTGNLSYAQNLISLSSSLRFTGNYQRHPWVRNEQKRQEFELNNYKANIYTVKNENTVTISPFVYTNLFKATSISWNISEIIAKTVFKGTYQNPEWKVERVKWDKDFITAHAGTAVFGVTLAEKYTQKLSFSANLPPLLKAYSGTAAFTFPYGSLTASTRIFEKEKAQKPFYWDPFKIELTGNFPYDLKAGLSYSYNIEESESEKLHFTFSWKHLSLFYTHARELPYKLDPSAGWQPRSTVKEFIPFETGLSFSNTSSPLTIYTWKNRIKLQFALTSHIRFNLIRVTDSYFTFSPKIVFNIHEFWDFSFGTSSRNDVIARYFQKLFNLPVVLPGNTNIITDLAHSFFFWDRSKRESSGFKLQSLDIALTHNLKDWLLKFTCEIRPEQKKDGSRITYVFSPTITFAVEWKPINNIKVQAKHKNNVFSLEKGEIR